MKAQDLLSNANRIVKTNAGRIQELTTEKTKLEQILKDMSRGNMPVVQQQQTIMIQPEAQKKPLMQQKKDIPVFEEEEELDDAELIESDEDEGTVQRNKAAHELRKL